MMPPPLMGMSPMRMHPPGMPGMMPPGMPPGMMPRMPPTSRMPLGMPPGMMPPKPEVKDENMDMELDDENGEQSDQVN